MAKYQIEWTEELWFRATIEAKDKQEAIDLWAEGSYLVDGRLEPYGTEIQNGIDITRIEED